MRASDVMTWTGVTVDERATIAEASQYIAWWKHLLFGPRFSAVEYVRTHTRSVASVTREPLAGSATDASILQQLEWDLAVQPWSPRHNISVTVKDGVVALSGTVLGYRRREALLILIYQIAGVREIRDQHLVVEPISPNGDRIDGDRAGMESLNDKPY